jgi:hypothetical protein
MKSVQGDKEYKSPVRKLARCFESSRNQWKAKCRAAKVKVKRLTNRVHALEQSRAHWKSRAQALAVELAAARAQRAAWEQEVAELRALPGDIVPESRALTEFSLRPRQQQYSIGHVMLFISLVLAAAVSLRGASKATGVMLALWHLPLPCPTWYTGRLWLLRLGYYKLTRPKPSAEDWVWIIDHTVQWGAHKCLVILGVRLAALPPVDTCLSHEDVEPLGLFPVTSSDGTVVCRQLEATVAKTGVPRAIISDHGSDLAAGVAKFCQAHPETSAIYDIKHQTAALLKQVLAPDEQWLAFTQAAAQTRNQVQQTALAPLAPPQQRSKARYMNVDGLIAWGAAVLTLLDHPAGTAPLGLEMTQVQAKLGWVTAFRQPMVEWHELLQLVTTAESFVRHQGLYHGVHQALAERLPQAHTARTRQVRKALLSFVAAEETKAHPKERLPGSSEVLESVLGKLKRLEQDQVKSGFTGLVLSVSALVSTTTKEVVQAALETVPTQRVLDWCKQTLGPSVQAQRRAVFAAPGETEQKRDQLCLVT